MGCGVILLHPGGVIDGLGEGRRVGAAESVADEVGYFFEYRFGNRWWHAFGDGASDELHTHLTHSDRVVGLGHELAKVVCIGQGHAGETMGYIEDLFLEKDDAVRVGENRLEAGVFVDDGFQAAASANEGVDHARL